jgi:hypothetical protein
MDVQATLFSPPTLPHVPHFPQQHAFPWFALAAVMGRARGGLPGFPRQGEAALQWLINVPDGNWARGGQDARPSRLIRPQVRKLKRHPIVDHPKPAPPSSLLNLQPNQSTNSPDMGMLQSDNNLGP